MFETQLGLRENPFLDGPHPKYLFQSRAHRDALFTLRDGLEHREPFVLITGDPGTGRTLAVYDALGEWGARAVVALITQPDLTPDELFEEICLRFGVDAPGPVLTSDDLASLLTDMHARGDLAILVIDGAEALDAELLAALERLSLLEVNGESLLRIILVADPGFETVLERPELRSLAERIRVRYRMELLSPDETVEYLHHRVSAAGGNAFDLFPTDTCFEVFRFAGGVPGEVNRIASHALRVASEAGSQVVTAEHVLAVAEPETFSLPPEGEPMVGETAPEGAANGTNGDATIASTVPTPRPKPEPFATAIPPAKPRSPRVTTAPERRPAANTPAPESDETEEPILPSWFDDIVARRKMTDEQEAQTTSAPVEAEADAAPRAEAVEPVNASASDAVETDAIEAHETPMDPAGAPPEELLAAATEMPDAPPRLITVESPTPVEPEPVPAPEAAVAEPPLVPEELSLAEAPEDTEPEPPAVELYLAPPPEVASVPQPPAPPVDFVPELESVPAGFVQAPRRTNLNWLAPVAILAGIAVAALLFIRLTTRAPENDAAKAGKTRATTRSSAHRTAPRSVSSAPKTPAPVTIAAPTPVKAAPAPVKAVAPPPVKAVTPAPVTPTVTTKAVTPANVKPAVTAKTQPPTTVKPSATPKAAAAAANPAATPASAKPAPGGASFGIMVGSYLFEDRAMSELTTVSGKTRLPSRIITVNDGGTSMFQVVVGSFGSRAAAEAQANELLRAGQLNEARVVSLPRTAPANP